MRLEELIEKLQQLQPQGAALYAPVSVVGVTVGDANEPLDFCHDVDSVSYEGGVVTLHTSL